MPKKATITQLNYDRANITRYSLKLHNKNDKDIIDAIDPENKQKSIKALIRKGIERSGGNDKQKRGSSY